MKSAIVDWITPKGQSLNLHIPRNAKAGRGFNHERTGALLCPARLDWNNVKYVFFYFLWNINWSCSRTRAKLMNGQIQVAGDQWPVFLYSDYAYDPEDPWNGLLRSSLLVSAGFLTLSLFCYSLTVEFRHSNMYSHLLAPWNKNQRWRALAMCVSMACKAHQGIHCICCHAGTVYLPLMIPPYWMVIGPLCLDFCPSIFSHWSRHRLRTFL